MQALKLDEIAHLFEIDDLETSKWTNQIGTLKQDGDTHWRSHFSSNFSLINLYGKTCFVLQKIIVDKSTYSQCRHVDGAYNSLTLFKFVLILYLMKEIIGTKNVIC